MSKLQEAPWELAPKGLLLSVLSVKTMNGETWCQSHLADQELHQLLEKVDADLAQEACQTAFRSASG